MAQSGSPTLGLALWMCLPLSTLHRSAMRTRLSGKSSLPIEFPAGYKLKIISVRIARFGRPSRHPGKERGANTPRGTSGRTIP
jgi:hypothetical protein